LNPIQEPPKSLQVPPSSPRGVNIQNKIPTQELLRALGNTTPWTQARYETSRC
jgi:hypothetical protein